MKFSLIVCTLGRFDDIDVLFASFIKQKYKHFEVILVDQNEDGYLTPILNKYEGAFPLTHVKSPKGLSIARNNGMKYVTGDIVCFPDDDCYYSEDTLEIVKNFFINNPTVKGVTSGYKSSDGRTGLHSPCRVKDITKNNVWKCAISFTIFVRKSALNSLSYYFDESLGVGANTKWGAGEETDFLLRVMMNNKLAMIPDVGIYHPVKEAFSGGYDKKRVQSYARGMGRVLRLRKYNKILVLTSFALTTLKIIRGIVKRDKQIIQFYKDTLVYRVKGYLD
ncbi:glycosyltransferase family 2 protein [Klebsiella aerogenes]|nr:glycosyltransferase family 2 protein [Klebsiella aerogenes]